MEQQPKWEVARSHRDQGASKGPTEEIVDPTRTGKVESNLQLKWPYLDHHEVEQPSGDESDDDDRDDDD